MKKLLILGLVAFITLKISAQTPKAEKSTFYINVFINENKDIRIESDIVEFKNISEKVKRRVYDHPFKLDESVTYRVFADKNLLLGYIMDVEKELFDGYINITNTRSERYLLETVKMEIDGPNWYNKLDGLKIDKVKG